MGYEIFWEGPHGVVKRHFGHVTGSELLKAVQETEEDPRFDSLHYVINDFRDCETLAVTPAEIVEIAAIDNAAARTNSRIRIAIVATHPDVVAIGNAYASDPLTRYGTRVLGSMDEARRWVEQELP